MALDTKMIRKGILNGLGYSESVYDDDQEFNEYTGLQHQIKNFLDEITKSNSEFQWFGFTEDDYIKMGIRIIKAKRSKGQFYDSIKKYNPEISFDFLLDPVSDYDIGVKYRQENYDAYLAIINHIHRIKNNVNNAFKDYNLMESNFYEEINGFIELLDTISEKIIARKADFYNAGYYDFSPCFIDTYIDLVNQFVKSMVHLIKVSSIMQARAFPFIENKKDYMDRLLYVLDVIDHKVDECLKEPDSYFETDNDTMKSVKDYNEKIRALSNYIKCKALYHEYQKTIDVLQEEMEKKPQKFDVIETVRSKKFRCFKTNDDQGKIKKARYLVTQGSREDAYFKRIADIKTLLRFAKENYGNDFIDLYVLNSNIIYKEIYKFKSKSPIFKRNATTIMKEFTDGKLFAQNDLKNFCDLPLLTQQKLRFLDMKFFRCYVCTNFSTEYYKLFCNIISKMWEILLKSFRAVNEYQIYETIKFTGTLFAKLISSDYIYGM